MWEVRQNIVQNFDNVVDSSCSSQHDLTSFDATSSFGRIRSDVVLLGESAEVMDIPHQMVGRVIGRGGETIKSLQTQSGCHITIDQNFPEGHPRKISMGGTPEAVARARQMITDLIAGGPAAVSVPGGAEKVLDIQQAYVGKIIGKVNTTPPRFADFSVLDLCTFQLASACRVEKPSKPCRLRQGLASRSTSSSGNAPSPAPSLPWMLQLR